MKLPFVAFTLHEHLIPVLENAPGQGEDSMDAAISFTANICFTGAPACGLEEMAVSIHRLTQAASSCDIPFFHQGFWLDRGSKFLENNLEYARKLMSVSDTYLGVYGPRGEAQGFYVLRGPCDVVTLARMQKIALPQEFVHTCSRLLKRMQLLVFQLPDFEFWRWRGFDQDRIDWFMRYTATLLEALRESGLRLEQFRVLPPQRGDMDGTLVQACWRIFGVAPHPLNPSQTTRPLASAARSYQAETRDIFEGRPGSPLGPPLVV